MLAESGIEAEMIEPAGDPAKEIEKIATPASSTRSSSARAASGPSAGCSKVACLSMSPRMPTRP